MQVATGEHGAPPYRDANLLVTAKFCNGCQFLQFQQFGLSPYVNPLLQGAEKRFGRALAQSIAVTVLLDCVLESKALSLLKWDPLQRK
jgi:hypothetical protein